MKKLILLVMVLMGCVGDISDEPESAEFGQVELAQVTLPDGYGHMGSMDRCWTNGHQFDWVSPGICGVPYTRNFFINLDTSGCTGANSADYVAGMTETKNALNGLLPQLGWRIVNPGPGVTTSVITIRCSNSIFPGSSSGAKGATKYSIDTLQDCSTTQDGQLCKYGNPESRVYKTRTDNFIASYSPPLTQTQKRTLITNISLHEGIHGVGLGHDICGSGPGETMLMGPEACMDVSHPSTWVKQNLSQFELDALRNYRP